MLTNWGGMTHICVNKLTIIGSDNGLSPGWRQAIIWINANCWLEPNEQSSMKSYLQYQYPYDIYSYMYCQQVFILMLL